MFETNKGYSNVLFDYETLFLLFCTCYFYINLWALWLRQLRASPVHSHKIVIYNFLLFWTWIILCHRCNWENECCRRTNVSNTSKQMQKHIQFPLLTISNPHEGSKVLIQIFRAQSEARKVIFAMTPKTLHSLCMRTGSWITIVLSVIHCKYSTSSKFRCPGKA